MVTPVVTYWPAFSPRPCGRQLICEPRQRVERMPQNGASAAFPMQGPIHRQPDSLRGQVDAAPVSHHAAFDPSRVACVVGNQRQRADAGPVVEAAVDNLDARQDAFDCLGDFLNRTIRGRGGKSRAMRKRKFGFHHAHEELVRIDARGTVEAERRHHAPMERPVDVQLPLRRHVGAGDFVPDAGAAVMLEESSEQGGPGIDMLLPASWAARAREAAAMRTCRVRASHSEFGAGFFHLTIVTLMHRR